MADAQEQAKRQPEVELDLDDVKDTDVSIEETKQEESKEPSLNVGEVDLGYTDHNKDQNKKEVDVIEDDGGAEDKTYENERETKLEQQDDFDDLSKVSDAVKKRIDKLTRKYREAERREKAALDFAKGLQKKYDDSQTKYDSADEKYLKEFDARVDAQREQVKRKLKEAIEANDADAIMQANDELTQLTVEKEKARIKMADREARLKQLEEQKNSVKEEPKYSEQDVVPQEPSSRAKEWAGKNTWFGNDRIMTNAAMTVHEDLVGMGVDVESDEYYNEIDKRMKENFPHRFAVQEQRRPVQKVASAGRTQQGRRSVRLTKSQVAIAKKLGVPLEEYAKFVKEV